MERETDREKEAAEVEQVRVNSPIPNRDSGMFLPSWNVQEKIAFIDSKQY